MKVHDVCMLSRWSYMKWCCKSRHQVVGKAIAVRE